MQMRSLDHIALNHQVDVNVICWVGIVGVNAPYFGCCQIHLSRSFKCEKILHRLLVAKIQLGVRADDEIVRRKAPFK